MTWLYFRFHLFKHCTFMNYKHSKICVCNNINMQSTRETFSYVWFKSKIIIDISSWKWLLQTITDISTQKDLHHNSFSRVHPQTVFYQSVKRSLRISSATSLAPADAQVKIIHPINLSHLIFNRLSFFIIIFLNI